jgi:uncharacterized membrane protein
MNTAQQVIVATFNTADQAEQVVPALEALSAHLHHLHLGDIAVLEKAPDGTVQVHETQDARAGLSRIAANVAGVTAWLVYGLFGLPGPVAGEIAFDSTTAAIKRAMRDMGFDDTELTALGEDLDAGSSALILVVPEAAAPPVAAELARLGGTVVQRPLTAEVAAELKARPPAPRPPSGEC